VDSRWIKRGAGEIGVGGGARGVRVGLSGMWAGIGAVEGCGRVCGKGWSRVDGLQGSDGLGGVCDVVASRNKRGVGGWEAWP